MRPLYIREYATADTAVRAHRDVEATERWTDAYYLQIWHPGPGKKLSKAIQDFPDAKGQDLQTYAVDRTSKRRPDLNNKKLIAKALWDHFHPEQARAARQAQASAGPMARFLGVASVNPSVGQPPPPGPPPPTLPTTGQPSSTPATSATNTKSTAASGSTVALQAAAMSLPSAVGSSSFSQGGPPPSSSVLSTASASSDPALVPLKVVVSSARRAEIRLELSRLTRESVARGQEQIETQLSILECAMDGMREAQLDGARAVMSYAVENRADLPLPVLAAIFKHIDQAHPNSPTSPQEVAAMLDGQPVDQWPRIIYQRYHGHPGAKRVNGFDPTTYLGYYAISSSSGLTGHLSKVGRLVDKSSVELPSIKRALGFVETWQKRVGDAASSTLTFQERMVTVGQTQLGLTPRRDNDGKGANLKGTVYNILGLGRPSSKRKTEGGGGLSASIGRAAIGTTTSIGEEDDSSAGAQVITKDELDLMGQLGGGVTRHRIGDASSPFADTAQASIDNTTFTFFRSPLALHPTNVAAHEEEVSSLELVTTVLYLSKFSLDTALAGIVHRQSAPYHLRDETIEEIGQPEQLVALSDNFINLGMAPFKKGRTGMPNVGVNDLVHQHSFESLARDGPFGEKVGEWSSPRLGEPSLRLLLLPHKLPDHPMGEPQRDSVQSQRRYPSFPHHFSSDRQGARALLHQARQLRQVSQRSRSPSRSCTAHL